MLTIINSISQLPFSQLMQVYTESNRYNGIARYPNLSATEQLICAEQDFYQYLHSVFFRQKDSFYAIWEENGQYLSALRMEPYQDGLLLSALETAPEQRGRGYAQVLIRAVQGYLAGMKSGILYSHISKRNLASLAVHKRCCFRVVADHAVYSDGSVLHSSLTLSYQYKKSENPM